MSDEARISFQVIRVSQNAHNILRISPLRAPVGTLRADAYELVGRIVLDTNKDRYFVETPHWNERSYEWIRVEKEYVVFQAAFNAAVKPKMME